ncbi:MAG: FHA domain-containing protein [Planctomycetota bacterium]|nr:FHA domain-containing protein [Planctomycetota bacterium]
MGTLPAKVNVQLTQKLERSHEVHDGTTVGRDSNCSIQVLSPAVSRFHARFSVEGPLFHIHDLRSENGTSVNGVRIQACRLDEGDTIRVGPVEMTFQIKERIVKEANIFRLIDADPNQKKMRSLTLLSDFGLVFPTEADIIESACRTCEMAVRSYGFDSESEEKFVTAIREAINNAQRHGNRLVKSKDIRVLIFQDDEKVTFSVMDEGDGFDFLAELHRSQEGSAVDVARQRYLGGGTGGLGIRLMLKCVDRLRYGGTGSRIHLTKFKHKKDIIASDDDILTEEEEAFMRAILGRT